TVKSVTNATKASTASHTNAPRKTMTRPKVPMTAVTTALDMRDDNDAISKPGAYKHSAPCDNGPTMPIAMMGAKYQTGHPATIPPTGPSFVPNIEPSKAPKLMTAKHPTKSPPP